MSMNAFSEAEKQLLIAAGWFRSRYGLMAGMGSQSRPTRQSLRDFAAVWMGKYLVGWAGAFESLIGRGLLRESDGQCSLTEEGEAARKALEETTPLWLYEYNNFFSAAEKSRAHALFCERVYGLNLCQHGLADVSQLEKLLEVLDLRETARVLDLGCGSGLITEYMQQRSGAFFEGVDISEVAIKRARERAEAAMNNRLAFSIGNMNRLEFEPQTFDAVVSIDTLYYVSDLEQTLRQMICLLKPSGQLGLFYTQWINDAEERVKLLPEETQLATLLKKHDLSFTTQDLTEREAAHWRKKVEALEQLRPEFEREGNQALYDYRYSEAVRYADWDSSKRSRYLYHVRL